MAENEQNKPDPYGVINQSMLIHTNRLARTMLDKAVGTGKCKYCGKTTELIFYRRNTEYADDKKNWCTSCKECRKRDDEEMDERWREYNSGRL